MEVPASFMRRLAYSLGVVLLACALPLGAAEPDLGVQAITKPSGDVTLSFSRPGRVARVLVKEGQTVRAGEVLAQQEDEAELVQLRQLEAEANSTTRIRAAEAQRTQKQVDANKMAEAFEKKAVSPMEYQHAVLDVMIADLTVELSRFEASQARLKYLEANAQVQRMRLASPISGRVEKVFVQEGESRDAQQPIVRVVTICPLWIDAPVPLRLGRLLNKDSAVSVEFPQEGGARAKGRVVYVADVADAASETLLVRVEVDNPAFRKAGERVLVRFEAPARAGGSAATQPSLQPKESP